MGRKGWTGLVERQNRYYMRARYLFFGAALFGFLLVLFVFSARIMGWIGDKDLGQMLPIKQMKSLLAFEAFFF